MEFRILGGLEVCDDDGTSVDLGGRQQRVVLATLLLNRNEVVSVDRLIDVVWGGRPPANAAKNVQVHVSRLRKALESAAPNAGRQVVRTRANGYVLDVGSGELDAERFEQLVEEGRRALSAHEPAAARGSLEEALGLWRGQALADFTYDSFAQSEIRRLDELRLGAVEERIDADLALGETDSIAPQLRALVTEHPTRERLCGQLMLVLYRAGRKAEALRAYDDTRRVLAEELGLEPSATLQQLHRAVLTDDASVANETPSSGEPARAAPPPTARAGHSRAVVIALVALLAALAILGALLAARDSGGGLASVPPNYVGAVDPATNAVVAAIPVGIRPGPVAAGVGALWVGNLDDRSLTKIDLRARSASATYSLDGRTPTGLATGAGAVWVAHGRGNELSRVEPQFGQAEAIVVAGRAHGSPSGSVAVGAGFVWAVFGDSTLARVAPRTLRRAGSTLAGGSPAALVVVPGAVWVANGGDATVQRFDPVTFEEGPIRSISVGERPVAIAEGEGALWVANEGDGTVTRVDPNSRSTATIAVGEGPVGVAVGAGGVWVALEREGMLVRIDPDTNEVAERIEIGNAPAGVVVADGVVWVTVQAQRPT